MEKYSKKIPISKEDKQLIIRSFEDGEFLYYEIEREHPTVTHIAKGLTLWNYIFTELDKNFNKDGYQIGIINRGIWEALFIYDEETKYLYTFMRYKNFINLQNKKPENKLFHYANVLSTLNNNLKGVYQPEYEQMSFIKELPLAPDTDEVLKELLNEMVFKIKGEIERYAIVAVEQIKGKIQDIQCIIPIYNFEKMYSESWKEFINVHYEVEVPNSIQAVELTPEIKLTYKEPEIKLKVKEKGDKRKSNDDKSVIIKMKEKRDEKVSNEDKDINLIMKEKREKKGSEDGEKK